MKRNIKINDNISIIGLDRVDKFETGLLVFIIDLQVLDNERKAHGIKLDKEYYNDKCWVDYVNYDKVKNEIISHELHYVSNCGINHSPIQLTINEIIFINGYVMAKVENEIENL